MENPTHGFKETNLVLQLVWESQIKSKTVMSSSSRMKKEGIFYSVYFVRRDFLKNWSFVSVFSVLSTLSGYTHFYISKNIFSYTFVACF